MLRIRPNQMRALEAASMLAFENRTYAHLQQYFASHCSILGEEQMRLVIRYGLKTAQSYGFTAECCVRTYIEFMCLLGGHFDTNPLLPWAARILNDRTAEQIERGDLLYDTAWQYVQHLVPDYRDSTGKPITARFIGELRQLRHVPDDPIAAAAKPTFTEELLSTLERAFPAKFGYIGEGPVRGLMAEAIEAAGRYGIRGERGLILFATLTFVLGSGFDDDLLLPWASAILGDPALAPEKLKVDKLYAAGVGFLRAWWSMPHGENA